MTDSDHQRLKVEIDGIIKTIDNAMKKIENIIPVKEKNTNGSQNDSGEKSHDLLPKK